MLVTAFLSPAPVQSSSGGRDTDLPPERWREWPVVPELSAQAIEILQTAAQNPALEAHTFSKLGDCQFTPATFLAGYVKGDYALPAGYEDTAHYFKESMVRDSITAANGLGVSSVLNPMFAAGAGYRECRNNESPLDCELRTRRPVVVLVALGTNWKPGQEITFEENLRLVGTMAEVLAARCRDAAAPTFPPEGLYFLGPYYDAVHAIPQHTAAMDWIV